MSHPFETDSHAVEEWQEIEYGEFIDTFQGQLDLDLEKGDIQTGVTITDHNLEYVQETSIPNNGEVRISADRGISIVYDPVAQTYEGRIMNAVLKEENRADRLKNILEESDYSGNFHQIKP